VPANADPTTATAITMVKESFFIVCFLFYSQLLSYSGVDK